MNAVSMELGKFLVLHSLRKEPDELELQAILWAEAFEDVTDADLVAACREVRKVSRYMPTPAEILDMHHALARSRRSNLTALPETTWTPEDAERSAAKGKALLDRLRHGMRQ